MMRFVRGMVLCCLFSFLLVSLFRWPVLIKKEEALENREREMINIEAPMALDEGKKLFIALTDEKENKIIFWLRARNSDDATVSKMHITVEEEGRPSCTFSVKGRSLREYSCTLEVQGPQQKFLLTHLPSGPVPGPGIVTVADIRSSREGNTL